MYEQKTAGTSKEVESLGHELKDQGFKAPFWAASKHFFRLQNSQTGYGAHLASYSNENGASFSTSKAVRLKADHSPPSST